MPFLNEKDEAIVGRAMLAAALDAFGEFPNCADDESCAMLARGVVRAIAAATRAGDDENTRMKEKYGDPHLQAMASANEAVATAFWMWSEAPDIPIDEITAATVIGGRYMGFAQGMAAARAATECLAILDDEFGDTSVGAEWILTMDDSSE